MYENEPACFRCGQTGHLRAQCPQDSPAPAPTSQSDRPDWCGECDRRTRLIDHGDRMQRCPRCWAWPAKGTYPGQLLPQHKRCGGCNQVIFTWDQMPCGKHQPLTMSYAE